jgi:hypothetical protein
MSQKYGIEKRGTQCPMMTIEQDRLLFWRLTDDNGHYMGPPFRSWAAARNALSRAMIWRQVGISRDEMQARLNRDYPFGH